MYLSAVTDMVARWLIGRFSEKQFKALSFLQHTGIAVVGDLTNTGA